jgi:hypothetical protein
MPQIRDATTLLHVNDKMCVGMTSVTKKCPINLAKNNNLHEEKW